MSSSSIKSDDGSEMLIMTYQKKEELLKNEELTKTEFIAIDSLVQNEQKNTSNQKIKARVNKWNKVKVALPPQLRGKVSGVGHVLYKGLQSVGGASKQAFRFIANTSKGKNAEEFVAEGGPEKEIGSATKAVRRPLYEREYRSKRGSLHHYSFVRILSVDTVHMVNLVKRFSLEMQRFSLHMPIAGEHEIAERHALVGRDTMLNKVHQRPLYSAKDGSACGVQRPNHAIIYLADEPLTEGEFSLPFGALTPYYIDGNLLLKLQENNSLSTKRRVNISLQLACGTANIHHAGYYAGDQQPQKVLLHGARADHTGIGAMAKITTIEDFDKLPPNAPPWGTRTPLYFSGEDLLLLFEAYKGRDIAAYNKMMESMDVTATAVTVYQTFVGSSFPYSFSSLGAADLLALDLGALQDVPELTKSQQSSLEGLLRRALDPDHQLRPSAAEFAKEMANIFPEQASKLLGG